MERLFSWHGWPWYGVVVWFALCLFEGWLLAYTMAKRRRRPPPDV